MTLLVDQLCFAIRTSAFFDDDLPGDAAHSRLVPSFGPA